jgi:threonine dehydrogenase-like Zn-dependent dehydrogenase
MCTRHDLPQKCERLWKYGHGEDGLDGTYSTHLRIRSGTAIFPLPPTLRAEWAAAANCVLATAVEALRRLPEPGRAMVLGGGLLGLFAAGLLRERGWEVRIVEGHPGRQASTEAAGFTVETTPSNPCDLLVEAAGSAELLHQAYPCLRIGGEIRLVGLTHPASALGLSAETIIRHCWTVRGNHNYRPDSLREALAAAVRLQDSLGIDAWWGPRFPLEEIEAAFAAAETRRWLRVFLAP